MCLTLYIIVCLIFLPECSHLDLALFSPTLVATYHIGHFSHMCLASHQLGSVVTLCI
jgi:hypothetical protein